MTARTHHRWTQDDNDYIKRNHKRMSCVDMAKYIGCSANALRTKMYDLGLRRFEHLEGKPCLPPRMDLMHNGNYVPPKPLDFVSEHDGLIDPQDCPSRSTGAEAVYRDHGHL
jgi:hypothetical protein